MADKMVSNNAGAPAEMDIIQNFSGSYSGILFCNEFLLDKVLDY